MSKIIKVSNNFVEAFKLFNVIDISHIIDELTTLELYLLLIKCLDEHDDSNPIVVLNFKDFFLGEEPIINSIYDFLDKQETDNKILLELVEITGDKIINTKDLRDNDGDRIEKLNTEEIREYKLKILKI